MTSKVTYRTGASASKLRTVIVDDVRTSVVLVPDGNLAVMSAKLLHGTSCRHVFWAEELGTDPDSDDFIIPLTQVDKVEEMRVAVKVRTHK